MAPLTVLIAAVLAALSALHFYWALDGRWGTRPRRRSAP
jgi:hypothetical protein